MEIPKGCGNLGRILASRIDDTGRALRGKVPNGRIADYR
jgi:hypothetical protein